MKRSLIIVLILSLIFVLSCSKGGNNAKGKVEITFWHALGGPLGEALTQMVDEFNKTMKLAQDMEEFVLDSGNVKEDDE